MKRIILFLMLILGFTQVYGQRTHSHTVYFSNMDGFTGYVKFETAYEGFATQLYGRKAELVITGYDATAEEISALNKAGLNLKRSTGNFRPDRFSFVVEGQAYTHHISWYNATGKSKLNLSNSTNSGGDYTTPSFPENAQKTAKEWQERNKGKSYWESFGGFNAEKVTAVYLSDLKNEINKILGEYRNKNRAFDTRVSSGTSEANNFNFEGAEHALAEAKELSNGSSEHRNKISQLERLITAKKKEEAQEKKEQQELAEKQAKEEKNDKTEEIVESGSSDKSAQGTASQAKDSGSDSKEKTEDKEDKSESKNTEKVYIPKTATQMYAELKEITDKAPGMLNDPKIRQRLRYLEVDANREQQTIRDYRAGVQYANNATIAQYNASNQKIDTYTKAVGDVTDAATGLVNSIIAASEEKQKRKQAERQAEYEREVQARENNKDYIDATKKARKEYIETIEKGIGENYEDFAVLYAATMSFVAKDYARNQKDMEHEVHSLRTYLVLNNDGKYGLLADDGNFIYPPQFDVAFPLILQKVQSKPGLISLWEEENPDRNFIAVKAEGRWGVLRGNGSVLFPLKYDYIFFLPHGNMILKEGNNYTFKVQGSLIIKDIVIKDGYSVDKNTISQLFPKGLIPVSVGKEGHLSESRSDIKNFYRGLQDKRVIKAYTYNAKGTCEIVDLDGNTKWTGTKNMLTQNNIQFYNAEISIYKDMREAYNFYYSVSGSWNSIIVFNGTDIVKISPITQKYLGVINPKTGKPYIMNTDDKTLYALDEQEVFLAAISPDGLIPVQRKGYIDQTGNLKIPYSNYFSGYTSHDRGPFMGGFENGYAAVQVGVERSYPVYNAIDVQGNITFAQNYNNKESLYYSLGWHFSEGAESFPKDKTKAFYYYLKAAGMGSVSAMNNIGVMYMQGDYVTRDVNEAIKWYKKAAKNGNNMAAKNLGFHYKESDVIESVKWFEQAAKSYPDAQYELAMLYYNNEKVWNRAKAVDWFKKVVENAKYDSDKRANANYYIGEVYEYQSNNELRKSAKDYFTKAAQGGHKIAQAKLEKKVKNNEIASFEIDKNNNVYLVSIVSYDFKRNILNGPFKWYYQNGNVQYSTNFKNGKEENKYVAYYEDGRINITGLMKAGKRIGVWNEYDRQGKMTTKEYNKDGELVSKVGLNEDDNNISHSNTSDTEVYLGVSIEPSPPIEKSKFLNWISESYRIPEAALKAQVKGTIMASFVVGTDGSLANIHIVNDLGYGTGEELVKILQLSEKWQPGILNGRPVRTSYTIPLKIH